MAHDVLLKKEVKTALMGLPVTYVGDDYITVGDQDIYLNCGGEIENLNSVVEQGGGFSGKYGQGSGQTPMYIGLEIPMIDTTLRVFIGIDQEGGHEVAFASTEDIEYAKKHGEPADAWVSGNDNLGYIKMTLKRGTDGIVFDKNNNLVIDNDTTTH